MPDPRDDHDGAGDGADRGAGARSGEPPPRPTRDGLAIAVAVGLVGVAFGVLARTSGLPVSKTCALSLLVFTGASQIAAVSIVGTGGSAAAALGAALLLAARNALYGPIAARWFGDEPLPAQLALTHVVIDESTGVGAAQPTVAAARRGFVAAGFGIYVLWNLGTLIGSLAGQVIGSAESWGLDAAFPAAFVALLVPHVRTRPGVVAAVVAAAVTVAAIPVLPAGAPVLLAALAVVPASFVPAGSAEP